MLKAHYKGKPITFSKGIQEVEWWTSRTWFEALSLELTSKIPADGCTTVTLTFWHDAPADSSAIPESARHVNFSAFAQTQGGAADFDTMPLGPQTRDGEPSTIRVLTAPGGPTKRITLAP